MDSTSGPTNADVCYLALTTRDKRFDGRFFTGVTSTGIYCRPVCKVRVPRQENCRFFLLAAQAEQAGFRPCLRCRPELAPANAVQVWSTQDASALLAQQAARLLDSPEPWCDGPPTASKLAARLGTSERHARRLFEAHWGVSPLQYLQTRRLLRAKQWLTDTALPIADVARLSGFASLRGFNAAFAAHYRLQPRELRKAGAHPPATDGLAHAAGLLLQASYREPYDIDAMLAFLDTRAVRGIELVNCREHWMARTVAVMHSGHIHTGWIRLQFLPSTCTVQLRVSETLANVLPLVLARVHDLLDLDADPDPINAQLEPYFPGTSGLRVPGTMDGFELAVRAILGQQVTVAAARTLTDRLVARFGAPLVTPFAELTHTFPTVDLLATASGDDLGALGIVRQRQSAIRTLALAVAGDALALHSRADVGTTLAALQALPGIGPWTAQYIAMRALRWPDAFPSGDIALQKALRVRDTQNPAQEAEQASQAWRPWRAYAVLRAWSLQKQ